MENKLIVWCLEEQNESGCVFLKELIYYRGGKRLVFTDRWDDDPLIFSNKEEAEIFKKKNGLHWMNVTEHMIM